MTKIEIAMLLITMLALGFILGLEYSEEKPAVIYDQS